MNFYTADPHFFHENILKFCKRPFQTVDEMNRKILHNYHSTVGPWDDLWILGDLAVCHVNMADRLSEMLASIPGRKHLVTGNHDKPWLKSLNLWSSVNSLLEIKDSGHRVTLCHYPMLTFPGARHGAIQIFGHIHQNWPGSRNSVNVGVDCWNFQPVTLKQVMERAKTLPMNPLWPTVEPGTDICYLDGRSCGIAGVSWQNGRPGEWLGTTVEKSPNRPRSELMSQRALRADAVRFLGDPAQPVSDRRCRFRDVVR